jgi:hypothetical protein
MKTKIQPGAELDYIAPAEMKEHLDAFARDWFQEKARGVTIARFDADSVVASNAILIPAKGTPEPIGPYKGFAWVLRSIRIFGLATGDVVNIYRTVTNGNKFAGQLTFAAPVYNPPNAGLVLLGDEKLVFQNLGNLTATGDITVNGEGVECAEPDLYKLIS